MDVHQHLKDGFLAGSTCFIASSAAAQQAVLDSASVPATNPILTQIVIPIISAILVPFLKDWAKEAHAKVKERRAAKKTRKNGNNNAVSPQ